MRKVRLNMIIISALLAISCKTGNSTRGETLVSYLDSKAIELSSSKDLDNIIENAGDCRFALLGEASHGTHEYYVWRDSISRRLISEKGFSFIAVEGDWASLYEVNRYVKNLDGAAESAEDILRSLERWPEWMWGNAEVLGLIEWIREYNKGLDFEDKVGFYGMDVYDEWNSMTSLLNFLEKHEIEIYHEIKSLYDCFTPYNEDIRSYLRSINSGQSDCSEKTKAVVDLLLDSRELFEGNSNYEYFYALQNAKVIKNAEKFYRKSAFRRGPDSWNVRAEHMFATVTSLQELYGNDSKGIVWAHNTHVGDARATDMARRGEVNIGQLTREEFGSEDVFITGFGTYEGSVKAGSQWEGAMQRMNIPRAHQDSYEHLLNQVKYNNYLLIFDTEDREHEALTEQRGHRAVGVVYNPQREVPDNYVITKLPFRYDAFIFFRTTRALDAL